MFEHLISKDVAALIPYPPGKPLEELERERGVTKAVKLASNENPLGPSPRAVEAIRNILPNLHRYPDGRGYYLKHALAHRHGLAPEQIILGNGSNEVIELLVRTYLPAGSEAVFSDPTFLVYAKVVQGAAAAARRVPLKNDRHDLAGLRDAVTEKTRLVFLDNPNNPTGTLTPPEDLEALIGDLPNHVILALDEAYVDFVRHGRLLDPAAVLSGNRPVVFLRTFSKAYGLAGLRVGYGLAHGELVDYMDRVRQPFNVNAAALAAALAALEDEEFYEQTRRLTWDGLDWLGGRLRDMGLTPHDTETNFLMIDLHRPADPVHEALLTKGVITRSLSSYGLDHILRINVGLPEENARFIESLGEVLAA